GRVRPALQQSPTAPRATAKPSSAPARPPRRYHRTDRAQAGHLRADQRIPQGGLASTKRQVSGHERVLAQHMMPSGRSWTASALATNPAGPAPAYVVDGVVWHSLRT